MNKQTIENLLLVLSEKHTDQKNAHDAFNELYWNYGKFLRVAVIGFLKSKGIYNEEMVDTVVSNTFIELYENPLNFTYYSDRHKSEETAFKAWICTIARNEFLDILKASIKHHEKNSSASEDDLVELTAETSDAENNLVEQMVDISVEEKSKSEIIKQLKRALSTLSERDRHILLSCYDYYEEGKYTPSQVLDYLCEYWGTTKPNIRKIKQRCFEKVKNLMESNPKLKTVK